jgi:hypothetical protein
MENKEQWLGWIDDQLKDMYKDDGFQNQGNNRVFKTEEDDRDIAVYLLETMRDLIKEK